MTDYVKTSIVIKQDALETLKKIYDHIAKDTCELHSFESFLGASAELSFKGDDEMIQDFRIWANAVKNMPLNIKYTELE